MKPLPFQMMDKAAGLLEQAGVKAYDPATEGFVMSLDPNRAAYNEQLYSDISTHTGCSVEEVRDVFSVNPELFMSIPTNEPHTSNHFNGFILAFSDNKQTGRDIFKRIFIQFPKALCWRPENFKRYWDEVSAQKGDPFVYFSGSRKKYFGLKLECIDTLEAS